MKSFVERAYPEEYKDLFSTLEDPPHIVRPEGVPPPPEKGDDASVAPPAAPTAPYGNRESNPPQLRQPSYVPSAWNMMPPAHAYPSQNTFCNPSS